MSDYEAGDKLRVLLCEHEFHAQCIDHWLKVSWLCGIGLSSLVKMFDKEITPVCNNM